MKPGNTIKQIFLKTRVISLLLFSSTFMKGILSTQRRRTFNEGKSERKKKEDKNIKMGQLSFNVQRQWNTIVYMILFYMSLSFLLKWCL